MVVSVSCEAELDCETHLSLDGIWLVDVSSSNSPVMQLLRSDVTIPEVK